MITKVPKISTIRGRIHAYAYKCGFTVVTQANGLHYIFDNRMGYTTHSNLSMDDVVRIVIDELYTIAFRNNPSLVGD